MNFNSYQEQAKETIQLNSSDDKFAEIVPFLGIIGEIGSVVTQMKIKFREKDSYVAFKDKLGEELGDVLWYLATIATQNDLKLEDIAAQNLLKVKDRFSVEDMSLYKDFDENYPESERFPDEFEIEFIPRDVKGKKQIVIINKSDGQPIGNPLTDNTYDDDGYRFHDIFHFGYLAILGWSPVLRKLLNKKRKSNLVVDENEDGARSQITEELVSLFIYHHAEDHDLLKNSMSVDSGIIKKVKNLVMKTEACQCSGKQWEHAILTSYRIFDILRRNNGGRVLVSKKNRTLIYLGKR